MKGIKQERDWVRVSYLDFNVSVLRHTENHCCDTHFIDKNHEVQSLKALPQSKKLLSDRTKLHVFICLVQDPCSCLLLPLRETYIQGHKYQLLFGSMLFSISINSTDYILLFCNLYVFSYKKLEEITFKIFIYCSVIKH